MQQIVASRLILAVKLHFVFKRFFSEQYVRNSVNTHLAWSTAIQAK